MDDFYRLKISRIVNFTLSQSASFKLLLLYLVFEYLRPQSMYPAIDVIPWTATILGLCAISLFAEKRLFRVRNSTNVLMILYFMVIVGSSLQGLSPSTSLLGLKTIIVLMLIYFMIINIVDTFEKMFVFVCLFILLTFKLSQFIFIRWIARGFAYEKYGASAGSAWLANSGELAIQLCIIFAISTCFAMAVWPQVTSRFKRGIMIFIPVTTVGGVLACGSRGSFLALAVVLFFMWLGAKRKGFGLIVMISLVVAIPMVLSERDRNRTLQMGMETDSTASNRLVRWGKGIEILQRNPVLGVGFENWAVADRVYFDGSGDECHNIFIECASELGLIGLLVFVLLIISCFKNNFETMQIAMGSGNVFAAYLAKSFNLALVAYLVAGFFVTVLYYPYFWVNLGMSVALNNATKKAIVNE